MVNFIFDLWDDDMMMPKIILFKKALFLGNRPKDKASHIDCTL